MGCALFLLHLRWGGWGGPAESGPESSTFIPLVPRLADA